MLSDLFPAHGLPEAYLGTRFFRDRVAQYYKPQTESAPEIERGIVCQICKGHVEQQRHIEQRCQLIRKFIPEYRESDILETRPDAETGETQLHKRFQNIIMERIGMIDESGIIPLAYYDVNVFKTVTYISHRQIVIFVDL